MELTDKEKQERESLIAKRHYNNVWFSQEEYSRLSELNLKLLHNTCPNPMCIGYNGTNNEKTCRYCGSPLFKTLYP